MPQMTFMPYRVYFYRFQWNGTTYWLTGGSRYAFLRSNEISQVNFNYQYAKCWPKVVHPRRFSRKQVYGETKKKASLIYSSYLVYEHRDACGAGPMGYEVSRNEYSVHWSTSRSRTHTFVMAALLNKSFQSRPIVQIVGWTMIQSPSPLPTGYYSYYCVTSQRQHPSLRG